MNAEDRSELATLRVQLFGMDGTGGAIGELRDDLTEVKRTVHRWDGALSLVKAAASVLGVGGIGLILVALMNAAPN